MHSCCLLTKTYTIRCLQMQLLRVVNNRAVSVGDITVVVEPVPDVVRPRATQNILALSHEPNAGVSLHGRHRISLRTALSLSCAVLIADQRQRLRAARFVWRHVTGPHTD